MAAGWYQTHWLTSDLFRLHASENGLKMAKNASLGVMATLMGVFFTRRGKRGFLGGVLSYFRV